MKYRFKSVMRTFRTPFTFPVLHKHDITGSLRCQLSLSLWARIGLRKNCSPGRCHRDKKSIWNFYDPIWAVVTHNLGTFKRFSLDPLNESGMKGGVTNCHIRPSKKIVEFLAEF